MKKYSNKCLSILAAMGSLLLIPQAQATTLTAAQVAQTAWGVGFRGGALVNAVAIADAESSFVVEAVHVNTPTSIDYGLWQINNYYHPTYIVSQLTNSASYNATAAYNISGYNPTTGSDWSQWTTFVNGAFVTYLTIARNAAQIPDSTVIRGNNDTVSTTESVSVRPSAGSASVTRTVSAASIGTVIGGPIVSVITGHTYRFVWWNIHWNDGGADGWSAEDYMNRTGSGPTQTRIISLSGNMAFGNVPVGSSAQRTLTINNTGNSTLNVSGLSYPSCLSGNWSGAIAANSSHDVTITFSPLLQTSYGGNITVNSDMTAGTSTIPFSGAGTVAPPNMSLTYNGTPIPNGDSSPTAAKGTDFGTVNYGSMTSPRTFTINNTGTGALNLTAIPRVQFSGANPSDFYMVVAAPSSPVGAGSSTTFQLVFEPSANTGLRSATVTIPNDDPNKNPYTFMVQGTPYVPPDVSPQLEYNGASINYGDISPTVSKGTDFGSVNVGSQSATHTFQLYNYGNINMTLTGSYVQLSGANSGDFAIVSTPSSPIAPNQYSPIGIRFQPTGSGLRTASILIYFDATYAPGITSPYTVALQGTGSATYIINASAGSGGGISPNGSLSKNAGDSQSFTATPNANYVVNQWLVDSGVMQTGGTSYTLNNIQAAHSVQVTFTQAVSPKLGNPHRTGTTFTLSVPTQVGFNYTLEYKNALSDANWTAGQMISGTGGTITLTDTGATGLSRFYHVRVQ
jgi:hypothetical protein